MYPSSWLFVKGDTSIRVVCPSPKVLDICGPGPSRSRYTFDGDDAVQAYQVELAEEFSSGGWVLMGQNYERREGNDRRTARRQTVDRRRPDAQSEAASGSIGRAHTVS
jgi:hypothetical protein